MAEANAAPHLTHELLTPNGSYMYVSQHGSQVLRLGLNGDEVFHPLTRLHAIGAPRLTDADKKLLPEELATKKIIGETVGDGGSWWSFEDDHEQGQLNPLAMHGPASAPYTTYALESIAGSSPIRMTAGGAENRIFKAFFGKDRYTVTRAFAITQDASGRDTATISTTIRNVGNQTATTPSAVEHSYLETGQESAFLLADRTKVSVGKFLKPVGHGGYNDMDQTPDPSEICFKQGMIAFVNADGHVVVYRATLETPQGEKILVERWALYRQHANDPYTAMEPRVRRITLEPDKSYTLNVAITTYNSAEEFYRAQAPNM